MNQKNMKNLICPHCLGALELVQMGVKYKEVYRDYWFCLVCKCSFLEEKGNLRFIRLQVVVEQKDYNDLEEKCRGLKKQN